MELKIDSDIDWYDLPEIESPFFAISAVKYGDPSGSTISGLDDVIQDIAGPSAIVSNKKRYFTKIIDGLKNGDIYLLKHNPTSPVFKWVNTGLDNGYWELAGSHGLSFDISAKYMLENVVREHYYFLKQWRVLQGDINNWCGFQS